MLLTQDSVEGGEQGTREVHETSTKDEEKRLVGWTSNSSKSCFTVQCCFPNQRSWRKNRGPQSQSKVLLLNTEVEPVLFVTPDRKAALSAWAAAWFCSPALALRWSPITHTLSLQYFTLGLQSKIFRLSSMLAWNLWIVVSQTIYCITVTSMAPASDFWNGLSRCRPASVFNIITSRIKYIKCIPLLKAALRKVLLSKGMWDADNDFPRPPTVICPELHCGKAQLSPQTMKYLCLFALMQIITSQRSNAGACSHTEWHALIFTCTHTHNRWCKCHGQSYN